MRKIEQNMLNAVDTLRHNRATASWSSDNTVVTNHDTSGGQATEIMLHGNHIATISPSPSLHVCLCGWNTPTTRSRLSALIRHFAAPYDHATQGAEFCKRYPNGLGVSAKAGKVRIHDARGITEINANDWHAVTL